MNKAGTYDEFTCTACDATSNLIRPSKSGGFYPTFCKSCIQKAVPMQTYTFELSRKIYTTCEIRADNEQKAVDLLRERVENDDVNELGSTSSVWEIDGMTIS
jgi:hypothetical protein